MVAPTACPPAAEFRRLLLSRASGQVIENLLGHLEQCPQCWETVGPLLSSDTLLDGVSLGLSSVEPGVLEELLAINTPSSEAGELLEGTVIGHYRIECLLGRGGMGAVYRASDTRLERQVALKVMLTKYAASPSSRERFLREARAAARITHDNVVTVYEADECDGVPFIAMQFLQGQSLNDSLRVQAKFLVPEIIRIASETAAGLAAAHAIGLVHRDIKPGNLWLESTGRVKVLDFGLAKPLDADIELTQHGGLVGTPAFMSPEQARGKLLDGRSDLFSLGVLLYRLVTGKLPFDGPNTMAVLMALGSDEPIRIRDQNPAVPPPLADLIHRMLAKNPADRPASAAEVVARLRTIGEPHQIWPKRWIAAGFVALVAVIVAGAVIIIRTQDGKETRIEVPDGAGVIVQNKDGKLLSVVTDAEDAAWEKSAARMTAEEQKTAVTARLKLKNPNFDEKSIFYQAEGGFITGLEIRNGEELADLTPIRALTGLTLLAIDGRSRNPADIRPLQGMKLTDLHLNGCPLKDVAPLKGMPLTNCFLWGNATTDLSPLAGMKLVRANIGNSRNKDLEIFRGMPLEFLCANHSEVEDLTPLRDCPLTRLEIDHTKVTNLAPVRGKAITLLAIDGTPVKDLSILKTMPLESLFIADAKQHRELLLGIPTLKTINNKPAAEVLGKP